MDRGLPWIATVTERNKEMKRKIELELSGSINLRTTQLRRFIDEAVALTGDDTPEVEIGVQIVPGDRPFDAYYTQITFSVEVNDE